MLLFPVIAGHPILRPDAFGKIAEHIVEEVVKHLPTVKAEAFDSQLLPFKAELTAQTDIVIVHNNFAVTERDLLRIKEVPAAELRVIGRGFGITLDNARHHILGDRRMPFFTRRFRKHGGVVKEIKNAAVQFIRSVGMLNDIVSARIEHQSAPRIVIILNMYEMEAREIRGFAVRIDHLKAVDHIVDDAVVVHNRIIPKVPDAQRERTVAVCFVVFEFPHAFTVPTVRGLFDNTDAITKDGFHIRQIRCRRIGNREHLTVLKNTRFGRYGFAVLCKGQLCLTVRADAYFATLHRRIDNHIVAQRAVKQQTLRQSRSPAHAESRLCPEIQLAVDGFENFGGGAVLKMAVVCHGDSLTPLHHCQCRNRVRVVGIRRRQDGQHLAERCRRVVLVVYLKVIIREPEMQIADNLGEAELFSIRDLLVADLDECLIFRQFFVFMCQNAFHHIFIAAFFGGFFDAGERCLVLFTVEPPHTADQHIGEHILFFGRFIQRFDRRQGGTICGFEARSVVFQSPEFELFHLAHHATHQRFVFIVGRLHNTVLLSELTSALTKAPLDRPLRKRQFCGDFLHRIPLEIVKRDRFADLFAECFHRFVQAFIPLRFGLRTEA